MLLIWQQCPQAQRVAGFQTWLSLNRAVRKGERAIWIQAPMLVKVKGEPGAGADDAARRMIFRNT